MALLTFSLTLSGGADKLSTVGLANGVAIGDKGICQLTFTAPAAAVQVGTAPGGTFTTTPYSVTGAATLTLGPWPSSPIRTSEIFMKGTAAQVVTGIIVTH